MLVVTEPVSDRVGLGPQPPKSKQSLTFPAEFSFLRVGQLLRDLRFSTRNLNFCFHRDDNLSQLLYTDSDSSG